MGWVYRILMSCWLVRGFWEIRSSQRFWKDSGERSSRQSLMTSKLSVN